MPQAGQVLPDGQMKDINRVEARRVLPEAVASEETSALETVVNEGTGRRAAIGQFAAGKTGTTSNFGDAWFVGWDNKYTVAVWVGYPDRLISMSTDFDGGPVEGGTFPALIWHDFMTSAIQVDRERAERIALGKSHGTEKEELTAPSGSAPAPAPSNGGGPKEAAPSRARRGARLGARRPQRERREREPGRWRRGRRSRRPRRRTRGLQHPPAHSRSTLARARRSARRGKRASEPLRTGNRSRERRRHALLQRRRRRPQRLGRAGRAPAATAQGRARARDVRVAGLARSAIRAWRPS